ncbi:MAG: FHA domain-containing protein, partial [Thermoanaerobaculia bacterium]
MEGWQVFFEIPGKPPVELREGESIIGRSRTSAVHIPETTVSRQHARVTVNDGGIVLLADLGSANGTVVNGEKVEGDRRLADGDRVLVGDAELVIRILAPAEAADATVRVVIPPLGPPPAGATVRMDFADAATPVLPTA